MQENPLEWATVDLIDDSIMKWRAVVNGPVRISDLLRSPSSLSTLLPSL